MPPDSGRVLIGMTSSRPYLIRAMHDWIVDNGMTPHLLVDASLPGAVVPMQFVEDGRILLNVSPGATQGLVVGNDRVTFSARFSGSPFQVSIPIHAVIAVYARENGQGMVFQDEQQADDRQQPDVTGSDVVKKPVLTVVK